MITWVSLIFSILIYIILILTHVLYYMKREHFWSIGHFSIWLVLLVPKIMPYKRLIIEKITPSIRGKPIKTYPKLFSSSFFETHGNYLMKICLAMVDAIAALSSGCLKFVETMWYIHIPSQSGNYYILYLFLEIVPFIAIFDFLILIRSH